MKQPYRIKMSSRQVDVWLDRVFQVCGTVDNPVVYFRGIDVTRYMTHAEIEELRQVMCEEGVGLIDNEEVSA